MYARGVVETDFFGQADFGQTDFGRTDFAMAEPTLAKVKVLDV